MNSVRIRAGILAAAVVVGGAAFVSADVKSQQKSQVKFEGMLGRMAGMFGGKAAKEGIVSTVAVKGDRKMEITGDTGEIIDLAEEKVYRLDMKDKSYKVVTFAELRRQFEEAQRKAKEEAAKADKEREKDKEKAEEPQVEVDFDLKETGQKKELLGHGCREVVMTITVREKGKTLEQGGGMVLTSAMWLAPEIAALKEEAAFDRKYAQKIYGELLSAETMQQAAAAMAMYPQMKQAIERMSKEQVNMSGTPLLTTMSFAAVASAAQAEQRRESEDSGGGGGLMGGLARRMMKKKAEEPKDGATPGRATIMTSTLEYLSIATDVQPADVALPAGFKQK